LFGTFPAVILQVQTIATPNIESRVSVFFVRFQPLLNTFSFFCSQTFRRLLVKKCQEEFVRRSNIFDEIDQLKAQGIQVGTDT
jgi:hypothetical protein